MIIFKKAADIGIFLQQKRQNNQKTGFVPTMGALHQGHISLIGNAGSENDLVVCSIFVNPTQFNDPKDFQNYPITIENDIDLLEKAGCDALFLPSVEEMYHGKTISKKFDFDGLENQMEGKFRPGHFDGVGTIVKRLFEIVNPTKAYFGEKDFQQLQIIRKLVEKEKLKVEIIGCPIFREKNGLAMSSRNARLNDIEKKEASIIYNTLIKAKEYFGTKSANEVSKFVKKTFSKSNMFDLEYFEIADEKTLVSCKRKNKNKKYRAFIAVFVNNVRLIDTISFN